MQKVVVFGASGLVGSRFLDLHKDDFEIVAPEHNAVDFTNPQQVKELLEIEKPEVVLNCAAVTNVEGSEDEKDDKEGPTYKVNSQAVKELAETCRELKIHLIHISTEYVFDGTKAGPYAEWDVPNPINWYGQTKYFAEEFIKQSEASYTIVRISMPFAAKFEAKKDIARTFLSRLQEKLEISAIADSEICPTFTDYIANALKVLIDKKPSGIYHCTSTDATTPFDFAGQIAKIFGLTTELIKETTIEEYGKNKKARLLKNSAMSSDKFIAEFGEGILNNLEDSLKEFEKQISVD